MTNSQRVLVVDDVSDTVEVLRTVLAPRGVHVERVRTSRRRTLGAASSQPPTVVVIDLEPSQIAAARCAGDTWDEVPQVIIGSARLPSHPEQEEVQPAREYLRKPFEYAELIRAVEKFIR